MALCFVEEEEEGRGGGTTKGSLGDSFLPNCCYRQACVAGLCSAGGKQAVSEFKPNSERCEWR